ncbi:hypothetical protein TNCV_3816741 [Trichonephila clavipes]|nr:hypothetical protein TNCV_3816741 [Trichonephila clavipes]
MFISPSLGRGLRVCSLTLSPHPRQISNNFFAQMKNQSHASRIPSTDQSLSCHSAECKNSTFVKPNIADYRDMGLRTVLLSGFPKRNAYPTTYLTYTSSYTQRPLSRNKICTYQTPVTSS